MWLGDANAAEPVDLDAAPSSALYTPLGNSGGNQSDSYDEDGIMLNIEQAIEAFRGLGKTAIRKVWRTEEDVNVTAKVHDARAECIRKYINNNAITTTAAAASTSGAKSVAIYRGHAVATHSLLIRSDDGSPYGDEFIAQIWMPNVFNAAADAINLAVKGDPIGVPFEWTGIYDATNGLGSIRLQTAVKTS